MFLRIKDQVYVAMHQQCLRHIAEYTHKEFLYLKTFFYWLEILVLKARNLVV